MTVPNRSLVVSSRFDRALAWRRGGSGRHLVTTLTAVSDAVTPPAALNLALSVDASGSMSGPKLDHAKRAGRSIVDGMTERDLLSVVVFGDRATLVSEPSAMGPEGRERARRLIDAIGIEGRTNLFEGWTTAATAVAGAMTRGTGRSNRVVLLSDGQTNVGTTERDVIARHVRALFDRDVVTSAVGIGDDYDEGMLGAIAQAGGGNLHDAARAPEIGEVVMGELAAGRSAILERVTLEVLVPPHVVAEDDAVWGATRSPHPSGGTLVTMTVGALLPGQRKTLSMRVRCPEGPAGEVLGFRVSARGMAVDGSGSVEAPTVSPTLTLAPGAANSAQQGDEAVAASAASAWASDLVHRAVALNGEGRGREAQAMIDAELARLVPYVAKLPNGAALLDEVRLVRERVAVKWDERTRKHVYASNYKSSRGEADYRTAGMGTVSDSLRGR